MAKHAGRMHGRQDLGLDGDAIRKAEAAADHPRVGRGEIHEEPSPVANNPPSTAPEYLEPPKPRCSIIRCDAASQPQLAVLCTSTHDQHAYARLPHSFITPEQSKLARGNAVERFDTFPILTCQACSRILIIGSLCITFPGKDSAPVMFLSCQLLSLSPGKKIEDIPFSQSPILQK